MATNGCNQSAESGTGHIEVPLSFRTMNIIPTRQELFEKPLHLHKNIVGTSYPDTETYLNIHFRLLLEDFIDPLRSNIKFYIDHYQGRGRASRYENMNLYYEVRKMHFNKEKGDYLMQFSRKGLGNVDWESSKRLIHGSLVLLTTDHFKSFTFATVSESRPKLLASGRVGIKPLSELPDNFHVDSFVMAETPAFFEPYRAVLSNLQLMTSSTFPFKKYFLLRKVSTKPPEYLSPNAIFSSSLNQYRVLDIASWPSAKEFHLNSSQFRAFQIALTQEIALIQGPPGTGKTYVGLKIVEALLFNDVYWTNAEHSAPILIVCYTNHALDQFLESILQFTRKIIRFGSQSKSEKLKRYSVGSWRRRLLNRSGNNSVRKIQGKISEVLQKIGFAKNICDNLDNGLLHEDTLRQLGIMSSSMYSSLQSFQSSRKDSSLLWWLVWDSDAILNSSFDKFEFQKDPSLIGVGSLNPRILPSHFSRGLNKEILLYNRLSADRLTTEEPAEIDYIKFNQNQLKRRLVVLRNLLINVVPIDEKGLKRAAGNLSQLSVAVRWQVYAYWKDKCRCLLKSKLTELETQLTALMEIRDDLKCLDDISICQKAKVIGMTTCGAAKNRNLLEVLQPKIVIVEEAAEVLEAHVVASLPSECQHLILIGDHQQLRPTTSSHRLAKEYQLDISLFERLIVSGMKHCTLDMQHRMRPEISRLITPSIYEKLSNDKSVLGRDNIKGMQKNVFFLTHNQNEVFNPEGKSFNNPHEAKVAVKLANYLCLQGYEQSSITVLTTYSDQLNYLNKIRSSMTIKQVNFSTVDNYQGEENDIIILSLVRSNENNSIGFLNTHNRVCVALSRARHGLYILGNMDMLAQNSPLWKSMKLTLEQHGEIGPYLELYCSKHEATMKVRKASDFPLSGCCNKICADVLPCGHLCNVESHRPHEHRDVKCKAQIWHVFPCCHLEIVECYLQNNQLKCPKEVLKKLDCGHEVKSLCGENLAKIVCPEMKEQVLSCGHATRVPCSSKRSELPECNQPCSRPNPHCTYSEKHRCPKLCYEKCEPCTILVEKTLPCGHKAAMMCLLDPLETNLSSSYECKELIAMGEFLRCGHELSVKCSYLNSGEDLSEDMKEDLCLNCKEPCSAILECGHKCRGDCGTCFNGSTHMPCMETCNRSLICGHTCSAACSAVCPPCRELCQNRCEHRSCEETCCSECTKCQEPCTWSCKHFKCTKLCWELCNRPKCDLPCSSLLPCSHPCMGFCGEPCPPICSICNHQDYLMLYENEDGSVFQGSGRLVFLPDCNHSVPAELLDHLRENLSPGTTHQIRNFLCPDCQTPVRLCQRYNPILKRYFSNLAYVKFLTFPKDTMENLVNVISFELGKHFKDFNLTKDPNYCQNILKRNSTSIHYNQEYRFLIQVVHEIVIQLKILFSKMRVMDDNNLLANRIGDNYYLRKEHYIKLKSRCTIFLKKLFCRPLLNESDYDSLMNEVERLHYFAFYYNFLIRGTKLREETNAKFYENLICCYPFDKNLLRKLFPGTCFKELSVEKKIFKKHVGFESGNWFRCKCGSVFSRLAKCEFCICHLN